MVGASTLTAVIGFSRLTWIVTGILTAAVIGMFGWLMSCRTTAGVRALEKVLGFEEFLSRVEADQIARLETRPELFEKFLPYAMALRVEKKWVQAFAGISMQPPRWYSGPYGAGRLSADLFGEQPEFHVVAGGYGDVVFTAQCGRFRRIGIWRRGIFRWRIRRRRGRRILDLRGSRPLRFFAVFARDGASRFRGRSLLGPGATRPRGAKRD